jgi:hypothetical protein
LQTQNLYPCRDDNKWLSQAQITKNCLEGISQNLGNDRFFNTSLAMVDDDVNRAKTSFG